MHKAKILGRKGVTHLMRPHIEGMAFNARLHPNRTDLLPKMLMGVADDLLGHCLSQRVVRFILDRDARHHEAPLPFLAVAATVGGHRPPCASWCGRKTLMRASSC